MEITRVKQAQLEGKEPHRKPASDNHMNGEGKYTRASRVEKIISMFFLVLPPCRESLFQCKTNRE